MVHQKVGTVDQQLDPHFQNEKFVNDNRQHLMTIIDVILFCAKQEIPLRADDESDVSRNKGNFLELLDFLAKYDDNVMRRMKTLPNNAKMRSPEIQNDLLQSTTSVLLSHIKHEVETAKYYAILADEVKDASKKELLGASLRYLHAGNIVERAIGFIELSEMDAKSISSKLLKLLEPFNINPLNCVGQGYDGASVMSGKNGGVQALIKAAGYVNATYIHCASHRLNLVLSATAERHPTIKSFFDTLDLAYTFMTGTKRHAAFLDIQRERYPNSQVLELTHSCSTRWSSRSMEVERFLRRFDCILDTLSLFEDDQDAETRLAAKSLLGVLHTQKTVILLVFFARLYDYSDFCTKGFQKSTTTVSSLQILLSDLKERLANFDFESVVEYANGLCEKYEVENFRVRNTGRQRRISARLKDSYVTSTLGQQSSSNSEELTAVLRQNVGEILAELDARFGGYQLGIMRAASCALPTSPNFLDKGYLTELLQMYSLKIPDPEIEVFRSFVTRHDVSKFETLMDVFDIIDKDIFPSIFALYKVLLTIPQTSCKVERMFSSVKRIKTRLRSKMSTVRLNSLALLSIEKEITNSISHSDVIDNFKSTKHRRLRL